MLSKDIKWLVNKSDEFFKDVENLEGAYFSTFERAYVCSKLLSFGSNSEDTESILKYIQIVLDECFYARRFENEKIKIKGGSTLTLIELIVSNIPKDTLMQFPCILNKKFILYHNQFKIDDRKTYKMLQELYK
jgi:hypothetical protein